MLYLTPQQPVAPSEPSGQSNLIKLYGLEEIAASVARTDPVTGAKRKLRKSYKNHIADLPGKHVIPTREEAPCLVEYARRPPPPKTDFAPVSSDILSKVKFLRSPQAGIPGFDAKLFATSAVTSPEASGGPEKKQRRDREKDGNVEKKRRLA